MMEKRCDLTRMLLGRDELDAAAEPLFCTTPEGFTFRVELVGWPGDDTEEEFECRPHLRIEGVQRAIQLAGLKPEPDEGVVPLKKRKEA